VYAEGVGEGNGREERDSNNEKAGSNGAAHGGGNGGGAKGGLRGAGGAGASRRANGGVRARWTRCWQGDAVRGART
jgi:hypothetical protein